MCKLINHIVMCLPYAYANILCCQIVFILTPILWTHKYSKMLKPFELKPEISKIDLITTTPGSGKMVWNIIIINVESVKRLILWIKVICLEHLLHTNAVFSVTKLGRFVAVSNGDGYLNILSTVFYAMYSMHCILCNVLNAVYFMYCIICIVFFGS